MADHLRLSAERGMDSSGAVRPPAMMALQTLRRCIPARTMAMLSRFASICFAHDGDDVRPLSLIERKACLSKLLRPLSRSKAGIGFALRRALGGRRPVGLQARLRAWLGGYRFQAAGFALPVWPQQELDQGEEPQRTRCPALDRIATATARYRVASLIRK